MPTLTSVEQVAESTMAELDQLAYSRRKEKTSVNSQEMAKPKIKKVEQGPQPTPGPGKGSGEKGSMPCKYFHTDDGCRTGKGCRFLRKIQEGDKKCWVCGSTRHFAGKCPMKEEKTSAGKVMKADADREPDEDIMSDKGAVCPSEDMKTLLEEASRMLKIMTSGSTSSEATGLEEMDDLRIKQLQKQLDDLRAGSGGRMKVLRLARVQATEAQNGLLDSGATHVLRPQLPGQDVKSYLRLGSRACKVRER